MVWSAHVTQGGSRFFRENAFLIAAVLLPVAVVAFFLLASAIPRWRVPPPAYDLLVRAGGPYDPTRPRVAVDFTVRDGQVEAIVRPVPDQGYSPLARLFLIEHETMEAREIRLDLPTDLAATDPPRTIAISALAGRRVLDQPKAPDGYEFQTRDGGGSGLVGGLFGMGRYDQRVALVNRGRVVTIRLPPPYQHYYHPVSPVGWLVD